MDVHKAEICGMHAGDGTLYRTNSGSVVWELRGGIDETDYYHNYVCPLVKTVFGIEVVPKRRSGGGTGSFGIQLSKKEITQFLMQFFPVGKKSAIVKIPPLILNSSTEVKGAFLRGLFDTDGCIRFDKNHTEHKYYPKIELSTNSVQLKDDVRLVLQELGIGCHYWKSGTGYSLCVPGKKNLAKWMELVSWSNPKHLNKLAQANFPRRVVP